VALNCGCIGGPVKVDARILGAAARLGLDVEPGGRDEPAPGNGGGGRMLGAPGADEGGRIEGARGGAGAAPGARAFTGTLCTGHITVSTECGSPQWGHRTKCWVIALPGGPQYARLWDRRARIFGVGVAPTGQTKPLAIKPCSSSGCEVAERGALSRILNGP
jgi:hypothetical protein